MKGYFMWYYKLHVFLTPNEITVVADLLKSDLLPTGIISELRQSNKDWHSTMSYELWRIISFDVTTACCLNMKWNICGRRLHEKWSITDWHHFSDWHSTKSYGLWRVISFDVTTACCLNNEWNNFGRRSHENWFITGGHHVRTPTIKQRLTFN